MNKEFHEVNLIGLVLKVLKYWWIFVIMVAAFSSVAYYYSINYISPMYVAGTTLFIGKESQDNSASISEVVRQGASLVEDYKQLVSTDQVLNQVIKQLNLKMSSRALSGRVDVASAKGTRFIYLSVTDTNPERAVLIANKISEVLKIKAEEVVKVKNVYIVDYASLPRYPISPNINLNVIIAGFAGLSFAFLIILIILAIRNTVENVEELEREFGLSVIGNIPKFKGDRR